MSKKLILISSLGLAAVLALAIAPIAYAVSGAAFTTFNAHVDGAGKDVCKNTAINCNIYGAKEYVWLNGGPTANGLGPDGEYFFAVLEPGGQPNPNDQGAVADKNLSDDYDCYQNRIFTVTDGEVSAYAGNFDCTDEGYAGYEPFRHWLDDGDKGPKPNWEPPFIRLFPYSDTTNPGGVYILAICSLDEGYPVEPRDCKYDAFKVKKGKIDFSFYLNGWKVEDLYADGYDAVDPGLEGWKIIISGTGPDGLPIYAEEYTDADGFWEWQSDTYTFTGKDKPQDVTLTVCEELQSGWTQSFPSGDGCHTFTFTPSGFDSFEGLNFANWLPVDVTACKVRDLDGELGGETVPVEGWMVSLTEGGTIVDTQPTGANGCFTWTGLTPGVVYDVHEETKAGWEHLGPTDWVFDRAQSGDSFSHTFVNAVFEGCTPGFWQGGPDKPDAKAGGALLWDGIDFVPPLDNPINPPPHVDQQWIDSGGANPPGNPYIHGTDFNTFFGGGAPDSYSMFELVDTGGGSENWRKAARSLVAAYLNASWGMNFPYTTAELESMWSAAVGNDAALLQLHTDLDAANNAYGRTDGGPHCPISAGGF